MCRKQETLQGKAHEKMFSSGLPFFSQHFKELFNISIGSKSFPLISLQNPYVHLKLEAVSKYTILLRYFFT